MLRVLLTVALIAGCATPMSEIRPEGRGFEKGLMRVCWHKGYAVYPKPGSTVSDACPSPEYVNWQGFPKKVYWGLPADFSVYDRSYDEALRFWNKEFNEKVLVTTTDLEQADISIVWGDYEGDGGGAMATRHFKTSQGRIVSTIYVKSPGDIREFYLHLAHEFGHSVFGLAHDPTGSSIMAPDAGNSVEGSVFDDDRTAAGMRLWFLRDYDKKLIMKTYGLTD